MRTTFKKYADGYRTETNHELNAYRDRLVQKLRTLANRQERWYKVGDAWILTEKENTLRNPNGEWKWNGWEVTGVEYYIRIFPAESVRVENGKPVYVIGLAKEIRAFTSAEEANAWWGEAKRIAREM